MRTIVFILLFTLTHGSVAASELMHHRYPGIDSGQQEEQASRQEASARVILMGAKDALSSGNVSYLRSHLGQRVYLNLFNGTNGYYSSDQAYIIISSFFLNWAPISFSFSSRNFSTANPYGFGPLTYDRRGRRGMAELFLSLTRVGERWVINQITVSSRS